MRWDLAESRKSRLDTGRKTEARELEQKLVQRVSEIFDEEEVRAPTGYLEVIRWACAADGLNLEPDDAERIWRAASGAAHGKYWPTIELQRSMPLAHDEPGQQRSVLVPDVDGITEVLRAAHDTMQVGVLRYLDYLGADIQGSLDTARVWYSEVIPLKPGVDREMVRDRWSNPPQEAPNP